MHYSKFLFLIGLILFGLLLWSLGTQGIVGIALIISSANPFVFSFALLLIIPGILLKGWKQSLLLGNFGKKISLKESSEVWLAGYLLGAMSPGRSGDFLRAVYFKKNFGIKTGNGVSCVLIERVLDVGFLLIAGIIGFIYFSLLFGLSQSIVFILCIVLAFFIILFLLLTRKETALRIGRPLFRLVPQRFRAKARSGFHDFFEGILAYKNNKKIVFFALLLTVFSWLLFFFQAYLLAFSLNIGISFATVSAMMPITTLAEIVPTVFGIGTRDFTLLGLFGLLGMVKETAISFSLTILLIEIIEAFFGAFFLRKIKNT